MKKALRKPEDATAQKLLKAFKNTSLLPLDAAICAARTLRIPKPTPIADDVATV
eukprot:CAMPEP_0185575798 /NCGR_PEP_ID=MMETSP0434-20130131/6886_1 /TAXON_ID=626734 ORGANISM="Favella taraikaensis, Strain Fe Narragansett Bay" /NCGR_SAMPLE_ID=MMETSP0434 /ASSEMBLY_ACC=CAM_ASM_000379 /LENGTH=53 /DNA_ID=CAMNT_0028192777 /DNA_START=510 /DNA_END=671 /DNA_ORIENTATION=-